MQIYSCKNEYSLLIKIRKIIAFFYAISKNFIASFFMRDTINITF